MTTLAWGRRVSAAFRDRVRAIASDLRCSPSDLMTCIAWETGRTFSASVRNAAGSGAVGLIQFMPGTAAALGTSSDKLARLTAEEQLAYVARYFAPFKGRLRNLGDLYFAILWPDGIGRPDEAVIWTQKTRPMTYLQNKGLDVNKDGVITRAEVLAKVSPLLAEGLRPANAFDLAA